MNKKFKFRLSIFLTIIIISGAYLFFSYTIDDDRFNRLKSLIDLNDKQRFLIKKYIFPYKLIDQQKKQILRIDEEILRTKESMMSLVSDRDELILRQAETIKQKERDIKKFFSSLELKIKKEGSDIELKESSYKLSNNTTLKKYKLISGFYAGIYSNFPGSGYIDFYEDNIFIVSSRGILAFRKELIDDEVNFKQIQNNINDFIGMKQFSKSGKSSIKDLLIANEKIYISFTEEIKEDCWNTSVLYGDINYENIKFKKIFSSKECVHSINNIDNQFEMWQSGGRLVSFDDNHILLSTGDYRSRFLAQDKESINGKIIKINIFNNDYKIISMGHRNPQGLYFDKENNFLLETEHGPQGGDEINLIDLYNENINKIPNYGWAIVSAGEHYGGKKESTNKQKYKKYPLYKSHSDYGFSEPLKSFVPSIAIAEIVKIGKNNYVVSTMKGDLYFFELNEQKEIINLDKVYVSERIRDLRFKDNKLFLFMETTGSIGVINLN